MGKVSRSTVVNILKRHGLDTGPKRGSGTWSEFIRQHAATLWACDFFSVKMMTLAGVVEFYVLFFLHIGTRRAFIPAATVHPDGDWVTQQARNFALHLDAEGLEISHLILDHDSKFVPEFDRVLEDEGAEMLRVGPGVPVLNAHAERWVGSVKRECLDHFVVFGEKHLLHLLRSYVDYYHEHRPHQGRENRPLSQDEHPPEILPFPTENVKCRERLGGLLKSYYVEAA